MRPNPNQINQCRGFGHRYAQCVRKYGEAPAQIGVQCRYASKLSTQNHIIAQPHLFWTDFNQNQNLNVNKFCFHIHLKNPAFINSISFKYCNICGSHPSCQQYGDLLPKLRPQIVTRSPFSALFAFMPRKARSCPSGPLDYVWLKPLQDFTLRDLIPCGSSHSINIQDVCNPIRLSYQQGRGKRLTIKNNGLEMNPLYRLYGGFYGRLSVSTVCIPQLPTG